MTVFSILILSSVWVMYRIINRRNVQLELRIILIFALVASTWYNINHNPHMILYLCNLTCMFAIYLAFKYEQRLFNLMFFFVWSGDLFTLLIIDNPVIPPIESDPIYWLAFYLKHIGPILLSVDLVRNHNKWVEYHAFKYAMIFMISYVVLMYIYDITFDQNILDLREPTLEFEKAFGPWPYYVFVNVSIGLFWFWGIDFVGKRLNIIKN